MEIAPPPLPIFRYLTDIFEFFYAYNLIILLMCYGNNGAMEWASPTQIASWGSLIKNSKKHFKFN